MTLLKTFSLAVWGLALTWLTGCGGGAGTLPVTGKVRFADGSPLPKGSLRIVNFQPAELGPAVKTKGASGNIQDDGSFTLETGRDMPGAFPGKYKVTIKILNYPDPKNLAPAKYDSPDTSGLTAEIKPGQQQFEFVLEK